MGTLANLRIAETDGAPDAFEALFVAQHDFVYRALRHLGVRADQVDDATQEVFLVIHRSLGARDPAIPLRAWVFAIVRRVAANARRSATRAGTLRERVEAEPVPPPPEGLERALDGRRALDAVQGFIDRLGEQQRIVFVCVELERMTAPEVAELIGISVNTVSSRLRLARGKFATFVARLRKGSRTP